MFSSTLSCGFGHWFSSTSQWMFSLAKHFGKKIVWHGKYRPDIGLLWWQERLVCVNLPPPCGEKILSWVTVRKGKYGGKYKVGLKPWLHSVSLLGILGPLHWFCYEAPQNYVQWGVAGPHREHRSGPLLTAGLSTSPPCLGQIKACLNQKYEWFSLASSSVTQEKQILITMI